MKNFLKILNEASENLFCKIIFFSRKHKRDFLDRPEVKEKIANKEIMIKQDKKTALEISLSALGALAPKRKDESFSIYIYNNKDS